MGYQNCEVIQESDLRRWVKHIFRILDLPEPLRQRFQDFGPARTLATKISEFWTCPNPCDKDFRIVDPKIWVKTVFRNLTQTYGGTIIATPSKIVKQRLVLPQTDLPLVRHLVILGS